MLQRISRNLCSRCCNTLLHHKKFQTVSEALNYQRSMSLLDPSESEPNNVNWMGYLTSLYEVDIKASIADMSPAECSRVFQLLMTQKIHPQSLIKLKKAISSVVTLDSTVNSNVLAGTIAYFLQQDHLNKNQKNKLDYSQETRIVQLKENPPNSNYDRIMMAYYWMHSNRVDVVQSYFKDVVLYDEFECFLMLKGLSIFPSRETFVKSVCTNIIGYQNVAKLSARLAFFDPVSFEVISVLLQRDETTATDNITEFIELISQLSSSHKEVLDITRQLRVPDDVLKLVCLNHHQSGRDKLFYTTFLALSDSSMLDLLPLVSQIQTSDKYKDCCHAMLSFLKLDLGDLISDLLNRISRPSFIRSNFPKHEWITRVVKEADFPLTSDNYNSLVINLPSTIRADLLKQCCDDGAHSNAEFISPLVFTSYEDGTLGKVFSMLLKSVGHLSASNYVDDCLLQTLPSLSTSDLLSFVRYLADHHILGLYQQKFWMVVGYDKKEDGHDLLLDILKDLYPDDETSVYFSSEDLHNLLVFVESDDIKEVLERKCDILSKAKNDFEDFVLKTKSTPRLLLSRENISFVILKEDFLLYRICKVFGVHSTICLLKNMSDLGKNTDQITELLKQIEEKEDYEMLNSLMKYYSLFLSSEIRHHGKKLLSRNTKAGMVRAYENFTATQMYYYSYVTHKPLDNNFLDHVLKENLVDEEIAHLLMIQYLHYPDNASTALPMLISEEYYKHLSRKDKKLLLHLTKYAQLSEENAADEMSSPSSS